jgi:hypothetical protein
MGWAKTKRSLFSSVEFLKPGFAKWGFTLCSSGLKFHKVKSKRTADRPQSKKTEQGQEWDQLSSWAKTTATVLPIADSHYTRPTGHLDPMIIQGKLSGAFSSIPCTRRRWKETVVNKYFSDPKIHIPSPWRDAYPYRLRHVETNILRDSVVTVVPPCIKAVMHGWEYAMVESCFQLWYFSNFENDFTEPSVPTYLRMNGELGQRVYVKLRLVWLSFFVLFYDKELEWNFSAKRKVLSFSFRLQPKVAVS